MFIRFYILVLLLDQITKYLATLNGEVIINSGVSFGIFKEVPAVFLTLGIIVLTIYMYLSLQNVWSRSPRVAGAFFGAVTSNILDRIVSGGVKDWLIIPFANIKNNIADWIICLCVGIILFLHYKASTHESAHRD